jgi:hypothetical protein
VWLWTTSTPALAAAIVRSIDIARRAASSGSDPANASHASWPIAPSREAPHACTSTSISLRSSRARYST